MSRGYIGEIFNSVQGEGLYVGRRQVFVRFAGCSLDCLYCDTEKFKEFQPRFCKVERKPSSMKFNRVKNPLSHEEVVRHVRRLATQDLHSVSITGGEPLQAGDFLLDVLKSCKQNNLITYLETNGASSETMRKVAGNVDIASIDVKLPEHKATPNTSWPKLLEEELECIKIALEHGIKTFVKIVVLTSTSVSAISSVCKEMSRVAKVPLVLQPVTPTRKVKSVPSMAQLYRLAKIATRAGMKEVLIMPQVHKLMGVI